jgi:hypothetical protein
MFAVRVGVAETTRQAATERTLAAESVYIPGTAAEP